jgi:hypothetical protein
MHHRWYPGGNCLIDNLLHVTGRSERWTRASLTTPMTRRRPLHSAKLHPVVPLLARIGKQKERLFRG